MQALDSITASWLAWEWQNLNASLATTSSPGETDKAPEKQRPLLRLQKIQQASHWDLTLHFWWSSSLKEHPFYNHLLFITIHPDGPFLAFVDPQQPLPYPLSLEESQTSGKANAFCMLLRKHLQGARLETVTCLPGEPVFLLTFSQVDELGYASQKQLVVELMGKYSNILLLEASDAEEQALIVGVAHGVSEKMSTLRQQKIGLLYQAPPKPSDKPLFTNIRPEDFAGYCQKLQAKDNNIPSATLYSEALRSMAWGLNRAFLALHAERLPQDKPEAWLLALQQMAQPSFQHRIRPCLSQHADYWTLLIETAKQETSYTTVNAAVSSYFLTQWRRALFNRYYQQLHTLLSAATKPCEKQLQQIQTELASQKAPEKRLRQWGNALLTAYASGQLLERLPEKSSISLPDPESGEALSITLNPAKSWPQNAEHCFRLAKKAFTKRQQLEQRQTRLKEKQAFYEQLALMLDQADSIDSLQAMYGDFAQFGLLGKKHQKTGKSGASKKTSPKGKRGKQAAHNSEWDAILRIPAENGWAIWVGRSNQANGQLVGKLAHPRDYWLHAHQQPGAHVLLKRPTDRPLSEAPPPALVEQAAQLAAWFSAARDSGLVTVLMTEARYVRRIPASWPGHVTYTHEQGIHIRPPEEAKITALLNA